jgi:hypothetical protein
MMRLRRIVLLGAVTAATALWLPVVAIAGTGHDPLHGDWQLDVEKSTFNPGPGPKGQLRSYRVNGDHEKLTARGVTSEKKPSLVQFEAKYDGKDYPITGSSGGDKISLRRIDALTTESTQKRDGKPAIITRRTVSADGKTLTVTAKGTLPDGRALDSILIFERHD